MGFLSDFKKSCSETAIKASLKAEGLENAVDSMTPSKTVHRREQDSEWISAASDMDIGLAGKTVAFMAVETVTGTNLPMPKHLDEARNSSKPGAASNKMTAIDAGKEDVSTLIAQYAGDLISASDASITLFGAFSLTCVVMYKALKEPEMVYEATQQLEQYRDMALAQTADLAEALKAGFSQKVEKSGEMFLGLFQFAKPCMEQQLANSMDYSSMPALGPGGGGMCTKQRGRKKTRSSDDDSA